MSLAVLELNDQLLLIQAANGLAHAAPGFARLSADGIESGVDARASAWLVPQNSYNHYWCHLNQTALAVKQKWARHHADIAFAQLQQLWHEVDSPDELVILVPGSFTDEQISLLLGLINALPASPVSVIDSALPACLSRPGDTLYMDMQLHLSVLSVGRTKGTTLSIVEQEVFPDLGLLQVYNSVARHISNLLVDSVRYDPLFTAKGEQAIFDQLPDWLTRLRWENEISAVMHSDKGEHPFILRRESVNRLLAERLVNVRSFIAKHPGCRLLLSHASGLLAGLSDDFASAEVLGQSAAIDQIFSVRADMPGRVDGLYRVQSLPHGQVSQQHNDSDTPLATHVLFGDQALPLRKPVSIHFGEQGIQMVSSLDKTAALTVVLRNRLLETVHRSSQVDTSVPGQCTPGESIMVGGHQLRLIEVHNG